MIKIIIDYEKLETLKQFFIKKLIIKRAYKGYEWYVKNGNKDPLSFSEFNSFDFWKIEMSFMIYFNIFKNGKFDNDYLNFKGIILNQTKS